MPTGRQEVRRNVNRFTRGYITEATPLNFPEEAAVEIINVDIDRDGTCRRRLGVDYETGFALNITPTEDIVQRSVNSFRWKAVAEDGRIEFLVLQFGRFIKIHNMTAETGSTSSNLLFSLNIDRFARQRNVVTVQSPFDFDSGKGVLFIVGNEIDPVTIEFNPDNGVFTPTRLQLLTRDFLGVEDKLGLEVRPINLRSDHKYNLENQGWTPLFYNTVKRFTAKYPANRDVASLSKNSFDQLDIDIFLNQNLQGNTQAPKGHFILRYFLDNKAATALISVQRQEIRIKQRPKCVGFFNGRVFYGVGSNLLFSQILEGNDVSFAPKCYQEQDPTAEELNELVDTDGGIIRIPESGDIVKLVPTKAGLIVLASEGVWEVTGSDGAFSATNLQVNKVTNVGVDSNKSVADLEGSAMMLSDTGIYTIGPDEVGQTVATNITENTIQDFYIAIPRAARDNGFIVYDRVGRRVFWFYNGTQGFDGSSSKSKTNKALIFDITLGAFYKYDIDPATGTSSAPAEIYAGYIDTDIQDRLETLNVVDELGNDVLDGVGAAVTVNANSVISTLTALKLITIKGNPGFIVVDYTISEFTNRAFVDWQQNADDNGGVAINYSAFLETGFDTIGEPMLDKETIQLNVYFRQTEKAFIDDGSGNAVFDFPSGCQLVGKFDFSDDDSSNLESISQEGYNLINNIVGVIGEPFVYGQSVVVSKLNLAGSGDNVRLLFTGEDGKDFQLIGWSHEYSVTNSAD